MNYKYCPNCGNKVNTNAHFCENCGHEFSSSSNRQSISRSNSHISDNNKMGCLTAFILTMVICGIMNIIYSANGSFICSPIVQLIIGIYFGYKSC